LSRSENTWEPQENLGCPDLIAEYEARVKAKTSKKSLGLREPEPQSAKKKRGESTGGSGLNTTSETQVEQEMPRGFDRGLVPEKIIGATDSSGELMFLMKWKNSDEADLVLAKTANVKCPQVVIQFYEERLTWNTADDKSQDESKAD
jgi:hypothetical protein